MTVSRPRIPQLSRRGLLATTAAAGVGAAGALAPSTAAAATVAPAVAQDRRFPGSPATFVRVRGGHFVVDGAPWRWAGANCYYLHYSSHYMIDNVLDDIAQMHLETVRAWTFVDGAPSNGVVLQPSPFVYDEAAFDSLDYAVWKAGQLGLRLVLTLTNNWPDFGGMSQYVTWFSAAGHDDFYTDPDIRRCYRAWAAHVISRRNRYTGLRYRDDPTIMTWELANEPRCGSDTSGNTLVRWAREMSHWVSRHAPHQLVSVGDEGFFGDAENADYPYSAYEGVAWSRLTALPDVDYGTVHLYPVGWGEKSDPRAWGHRWIADHLTAGVALGKPVVIEEFGLPDATQQGGYDATARDATYADWTAVVEAAGGAGDSVWLVTSRQDDGTFYPDYDGFRVTYPCTTATLLTAHADRLATGA